MHYALFDQVKKVLEKDERLVADGELLRNRIVELARRNDALLLKHLLADSQVRGAFFTDVEGVQVFDSDRFVRFINNKEFLPDSYTAFKNKIGLAGGDEFVSEKKEVVLNWPYKDCVLEGGQTKEDAKRDEVFWNETLAPDQIHRLLDPKVFTDWKRIDAKGDHKLDGLKIDEQGDIKDNLIIKGNNLLALHSLKARFAGKVKLIYIDPPYNTGSDDFGYNDRFNHSAWLTFMRNRLEVAKELLRDDGLIFVQIGHDEHAYLRILMDEIFGRDLFVNEITWKKYSGVKNQASKKLTTQQESILFYSKSGNYEINYLYNPLSEAYVKAEYKYLDEDGRRYAKLRGRGYQGGEKETTIKYLDENPGSPITTLWDEDYLQLNTSSAEKLKDFIGQKPEALLKRIIELSTKEDDLILDFFAGYGTTGAVAHKINRQWILCEQMDYIHDLPESRLIGVIQGDQTGISKEVGWKGGGDFVYAELMPLNQVFKEKVEKARDEKELAKVWGEIQEKGFLSYRLVLKDFDANAKDFASLSLADQKRFILESLDYNQLYVNYSEMEDTDYAVTPADKKLNKEFYL